jgi:hypothetical protein
MAACYAPMPIFAIRSSTSEGADVSAMWTMLCEAGRDLAIEWRDVKADDATESAHWEPRYTFSVTGRKVHNIIDARFTFRDGLIVTHTDTFNLWRWSRMALGPKAVVLGWTPFVKNAIKSEARRKFDGWMARRRP